MTTESVGPAPLEEAGRQHVVDQGTTTPQEAAGKVGFSHDVTKYLTDRAIPPQLAYEEGIRNGNVVETMDAGIAEGRTLFRQRIDPRVRDEKDFIIEELLRIARERGMQ